jgi:hypothetical protein
MTSVFLPRVSVRELSRSNRRNQLTLLRRNIAPYPQIVGVNAALWDRYRRPYRRSGSGVWSFRVTPHDERARVNRASPSASIPFSGVSGYLG